MSDVAPLKLDPSTLLPAKMEPPDTIPANLLPPAGYTIPQMWVFG